MKTIKRKIVISSSLVIIMNSEKEAENMNRLLSFVLNLIFLKFKIMKIIVQMIVRKSPHRSPYQKLF